MAAVGSVGDRRQRVLPVGGVEGDRGHGIFGRVLARPLGPVVEPLLLGDLHGVGERDAVVGDVVEVAHHHRRLAEHLVLLVKFQERLQGY